MMLYAYMYVQHCITMNIYIYTHIYIYTYDVITVMFGMCTAFGSLSFIMLAPEALCVDEIIGIIPRKLK